MQPTMNKGRGNINPHIADAVLEYEGRTYHIEIKASSKKVGHNIRFTHQTVTKAVGKDVIVALVSDVETGSPSFEFFKLSDVVQDLCVEPHFLVAAKHTRNKSQPLDKILTLPEATLDVSNLLDSSVRDHTSLRNPLWSPYVGNTDPDGEPYPPWLKYPNLPRTSMGWRMGEGESYAEEFEGWLARQPEEVLQNYQVKYPAPLEWAKIWPEHEA